MSTRLSTDPSLIRFSKSLWKLRISVGGENFYHKVVDDIDLKILDVIYKVPTNLVSIS